MTVTVTMTKAQARTLLRATKTHAQVLKAGGWGSKSTAQRSLQSAAKALETALEVKP